MTSRHFRERCREEKGLAGVEMLPSAILVFVVGSIIIINAWTVIDSWMAVSTAAREGARVYVESDPATAWPDARDRIADVMADYGRDERAVEPSAPALGRYERCAVVTITVGYEVAFITVPFIGAFGSLDTIEASHSERIDPYRSGDFEGTCT